jgi:hypothetical protein
VTRSGSSPREGVPGARAEPGADGGAARYRRADRRAGLGDGRPQRGPCLGTRPDRCAGAGTRGACWPRCPAMCPRPGC